MERNTAHTLDLDGEATNTTTQTTCSCSCCLIGCAGLRTNAKIDADRQEKILSAQCAICLDVLYEPVTITCGHTFCASCLLNVADKRCPACRASFAEYPKINIFIGNWLHKELYEEVSRKRNEYLRELCREVAESAVAPHATSDEPMFDNERLLRECNRREEQHRRRMRQEVHETPAHVHHPPTAAIETRTERLHHEEQARREIASAFSMDLVF
ncbi:zinc finger, C3HC4 type (RING finger) domain containing protein [Acanthamoeba castellanii str. Neff]|uniref:RING-type E3 ubiquitin transferase n=1 Tax=Acanthamoeba castellanii (strain ATCC 30010 / Neff) TaxID=1257118 RepID=L8H279_ACACF|nr:zinc finger, C3HC4 type (RING finger) domain containing protein [Acanthamoeba castellanii str. Neff]ELR19332.1 zinc finger, C3HC4 type (RING finger) domain containing protein [Acanthamoeba castellanii str. Neff]